MEQRMGLYELSKGLLYLLASGSQGISREKAREMVSNKLKEYRKIYLGQVQTKKIFALNENEGSDMLTSPVKIIVQDIIRENDVKESVHENLFKAIETIYQCEKLGFSVIAEVPTCLLIHLDKADKKLKH
jgi:hypothetical protein